MLKIYMKQYLKFKMVMYEFPNYGIISKTEESITEGSQSVKNSRKNHINQKERSQISIKIGHKKVCYLNTKEFSI